MKKKDGFIRTIERKSGMRYRAELHVNRERHSKTFKDEIDARIWIREKEKSIRYVTSMASDNTLHTQHTSQTVATESWDLLSTPGGKLIYKKSEVKKCSTKTDNL